jgi:putative hydrolase of the HAD superfamily
MVTTVIFDLDDTLFDEIDFCRSGFRAAARRVADLSDAQSADGVFAAFWESFLTGDRGSTFNSGLSRLGIPYDDHLIGTLVEIYRTHVPTLTLPAESRRVLENLQVRYTLGLLTDGFLPTQRLKVQALGIEHYFKAIVYTEELGREFWKPSPRGFERLLELLGARPEQAVYVADNEAKDFIAPNRLGMMTIQLRRPSGLYRQPAPQPGAAARLRIDKLSDLRGLLGS